MATATRDRFVSRLGVLAATLGSAVGLGNIWKFPALTGQHGGASFLLLYVLATLVVGLPLMIAELGMGRAERANPAAALRRLGPGAPWWLVGVSGVVTAVIILGYYSEVGGWVFAYVLKAVDGSAFAGDPAAAARTLHALMESPVRAVFWQWLVLVWVAAVILRGASKGIERLTRVLMPLLFLLLVVVCARSLTLPRASEGLRFLFMPDFGRIDGGVILMALGLAFFKMSVGMGIMFTYGSYFRDDVNIPLLATRVMFFDLLVSMLAGIAIFPAVFAFGFEPAAGPDLLFLTIPAVFASMPGGRLFTVLFFVLSAIAATGAMLSLLEVPVAWLIETFRLTRRRATLGATLFLLAFGLPAALAQGAWAHIRPFGLSFFGLYDFVSSNLLLPVNGLLICLFAGHVWGLSRALPALSNGGALANASLVRAVVLLCARVTPVLILIVLLHGLKVF